jgi:putative alpha-1,2-mannosidase
MSLLCLLLFAQHVISSSARVYTRQTTNADVLDRVDPLIGSRNGGNVFAGATLPYGMAKGKLDISNEHEQLLTAM